jgi:protein-tyrosine phosphatase
MNKIRESYGTERGLVRLLLSHVQVFARRAAILPPVPGDIKRLVFVCQGNICRSAFAHAIARQEALHAVSFGLSTSKGRPAHPPAIIAAERMGISLSDHRTLGIEDYHPLPGDLVLAMEVRQLHTLARNKRLKDIPRTLLGLYLRPAVPHLHDPYALNEAYMASCLQRIERAVVNLKEIFPAAKGGG